MVGVEKFLRKISKIKSKANDTVIDSLYIHNKRKKPTNGYSMQSQELIIKSANKNAMTSKVRV